MTVLRSLLVQATAGLLTAVGLAPAWSAAPPSLGPPTIVKANWESANLAAADLNGDGLTDFLTVNNRKSVLEVFYQKSVDGERTFEQQDTVLTHLVDAVAVGDVGGAFEADGEIAVAGGFGGDGVGEEVAHLEGQLDVVGEHLVVGVDGL